MVPPDGLHIDPEKKNWKGPRKGNDGKHLMSYAVGGVGIDHTDSSTLVELIDVIKTKYPKMAPGANKFFALRGTDFDEIRANGGVCSNPKMEIGSDLNGMPFGHSCYGGGSH